MQDKKRFYVLLLVLSFSFLLILLVGMSIAMAEEVSSEPVISSDVPVSSSSASSEPVSSLPSIEEPAFRSYALAANSDRLFPSAYYITATDSRLGTITLYIPSDATMLFGIDASGYLVYLGRSSISVYCSDVYNNSVSFSSFGRGTYRLDSDRYETRYLNLKVVESNLVLSDQPAPKYSISDFLPYLVLLIGGVLILCFMKR